MRNFLISFPFQNGGRFAGRFRSYGQKRLDQFSRNMDSLDIEWILITHWSKKIQFNVVSLLKIQKLKNLMSLDFFPNFYRLTKLPA